MIHTPSAVKSRVTAGEQLAMPEVPSLPMKVTVTALWCQPAAFARGSAKALTVGGLASRLMVTEAELAPAEFAAVHV